MATLTNPPADPTRQLAELHTKLSNLVGNAAHRLGTDNTDPGHVLDLVLDRLTELADNDTPVPHYREVNDERHTNRR